MKIYDQHLHTFLSSDSSERFENYIEKAQAKGITHFVTTEHFDLSSLYLGMDDIFDMDLQEELTKKLQYKYHNIQFLKGVEVGYKLSKIAEIEDTIHKRDFDVVIMSVHETETAECSTPDFYNLLSPDEAYDKFLNIYIEMLQKIDCYDIVGHIDFILRYIDKVHIEKHENKLKNLFQLIIAKNKSLEFNTRFLYRHNDSSYLVHLFRLYYKCGGRKVSLGSDAHTNYDFMASFEEAIQILKEIGFTHISHYQKRREISIAI